jgi:hypothetical protein
MTAADTTTLTDMEARSVVGATIGNLHQQGQFMAPPEPNAVLEVLTSHHTLLRGGTGAISFPHQQFQEWYASRHVSSLMRASAAGDLAARRELRVNVFDQPAWEECILFAVDRLSREDNASSILAKAVFDALPVDPMLAAEMIYRSPVDVWELVKADIQNFIKLWHTPSNSDRAVRFVIMTGRPDFAPIIWPLASSEDSQIQLPTLRSAPRFRPAVLGTDLLKKAAALLEPQREHLLALIASESGVDGMDLATDLAIADPSPHIQAEVIQYLQFRRADRHVARLLNNAHDETWALIARRGYAEEIRDPGIAARLRSERSRLIQESESPLEKLGLLLEQIPTYEGRDDAIAELIADPSFPVRDQHGESPLYLAQKRAPTAVRQALQKRLELGLELPFDAADLLHQLPTVEDGPIAAMVLDDTDEKREATQAAILVGPKLVESLLKMHIACARLLKTMRNDQALSARYRLLENRIATTRISSFVPALIATAEQDDPSVISALASLISQHGDRDEERNTALQVPAAFKDKIIGVVRRWVEAVTTSGTAKRYDLYPIANAIGRLGYRELIPEIKLLLDEDIGRLRRAREGFQDAQRRNDIEATSDARMIYGNQYQSALVRVGGDAAASLAMTYLEDPLFSVEAALVLMTLANLQASVSGQNSQAISFENVTVARAARAASEAPGTASKSEIAIFEAIDHLGQPDRDRDSQLLAIRLGGIALMMPHTNRDKEIAALMALPQPLNAKRDLLRAMALDGLVLDATLIMKAIDEWLLDAGKDERTAWHKRQNTWEIEPWLELLPFTDLPRSVVEGMRKVKEFYGAGHRQKFDRVVSAVSKVPGPDGEALLYEFVRVHSGIASDYTWTRAILSRDTVSSVLMCIELVTEGIIGRSRSVGDSWHLARQIAPLVKRYPDLEVELRKRYGSIVEGPGQQLVERLFSEMGDSEDVIVMVETYIASGRPFDGQLAHALRGATISHEPVDGSENSFYVRPASVAKLRKFLFGLTAGKGNEVALARQCLVGVDDLRDEHGMAAGDPRHPDIGSDRPWPAEAGQIRDQSP